MEGFHAAAPIIPNPAGGEIPQAGRDAGHVEEAPGDAKANYLYSTTGDCGAEQVITFDIATTTIIFNTTITLATRYPTYKHPFPSTYEFFND
ncbi:hypothetical protein N7527_007317 [Penicillium freii]|nr:hypothetical protein N7527_007317 [Penicillium freii]